MEQKAKNILEFWLEMEGLKAHFPIKKNSLILKGEEEQMLPWNMIKDRRHEIYLGKISMADMLDALCLLTGDEKPQKRSQEFLCMGGFAVDENGVYVEGSFHYCPFFAAAATILKENSFQADWRPEHLAFQNQTMDGFLQASQSSLTREDLAVILRKIQTVFHFSYEDSFLAFINTKIISRKFEESPADPAEIELGASFYKKDLEQIAQEIAQEDPLYSYIAGCCGPGNSTVEQEQFSEAAKPWIHPQKYPMGRWPSKTVPNLMQQLVVNVSSTGQEADPFFCINAPAGSGAVFCLKELVANQVVSRARQLSAHLPHQYFKEIKINGYPDGKYELSRYYQVPEELTSFGIVVASENHDLLDQAFRELTTAAYVREGSTHTGRFDLGRQKEIYFSDMASELLEEDLSGWGFLAAPLGEISKIRIFNRLIASNSAYSMLGKHYQKDGIPWETVTEEFSKAWEAVEHYRQEVKEDYDLLLGFEPQIQCVEEKKKQLREMEGQTHETNAALAEIQEALRMNEEQTRQVEEQVAYLKSHLSVWGKVKVAVGNGNLAQEIKQLQRTKEEMLIAHGSLRGQQSDLEKTQSDFAQKQEVLAQEILLEEKKIAEIKETLLALGEENSGKYRYKGKQNFPSEDFLAGSWDQEIIQKSCPWTNETYDALRETLFYWALQVQKSFVLQSEAVKQNLNMLNHFWGANEFAQVHRQEMFPHLLNTLSILTPVLLTDLESVASWLNYAGKESLGTLMVLDAGRTAPWSCLGAMWRTKRTVLMGDLFQMEPEAFAPERMIRVMADRHGVERNYASLKLSAQKLGVSWNSLQDTIGGIRVGCPLWVRTGIQDPMLAISNEISYENRTIAGDRQVEEQTPNCILPSSGWFDIKEEAGAEDHDEEKQTAIALRLIHTAIEQHGTEMFAMGQTHLLLVTPFPALAATLQQIVYDLYHDNHCFRYISKEDVRTKWVGAFVGTVESFQGRQASEVIMVLGGNERNENASAPLLGNPSNMLNTAVSMARDRFVLVGDKKRWEQVPCFRKAAQLLADLAE